MAGVASDTRTAMSFGDLAPLRFGSANLQMVPGRKLPEWVMAIPRGPKGEKRPPDVAGAESSAEALGERSRITARIFWC